MFNRQGKDVADLLVVALDCWLHDRHNVMLRRWMHVDGTVPRAESEDHSITVRYYLNPPKTSASDDAHAAFSQCRVTLWKRSSEDRRIPWFTP